MKLLKMSMIYRLKLLAIAALAGVILTGCGSIIPPVGQSVSQSQFELPTARPSVAPSPVSTRVMPTDSLTPTAIPSITPIPDEALGLVVEVFDGNTIAVVMNGDPMTLAYQVRYLGIEAPPNVPADPWGVVSYETNRDLTNLKVVRLVRDQTEFDEDGYLLRYVYVENQLVNSQLVELGLAKAAPKLPDIRFEKQIAAAEEKAKAARLGLWGPEPPTVTPTREPVVRKATATFTPVVEEQPEVTAIPSVTVTVEATTTVTSTVEATPAGN
jgi:micrococcal nuclease